MRNLHDITARQSEADLWRAFMRGAETTLVPWQRGVVETLGYVDPLHQWDAGTARDAHVILGELERAADRLRAAGLDHLPHVALEISRREMYVLRLNLPFVTFNNLFPEGTVPQFRGIPLMLR